ncbi:MAG: lysyl oxidase family protein [Actinomycetes bacterium]
MKRGPVGSQLSPIRTAGLMFAALLVPATTLALLASPATAVDTPAPSIKLVSGSDTAEIHLYRQGRYEIHLPLFMASDGGAFELWAQRPTYDDPVQLRQVIRDGNGVVVSNHQIIGVPEPRLSAGLPGFLQMELTHRNGTSLKDLVRPFCPTAWRSERMDDTGPTVPTYPADCWASPFTRGGVWGIHQGWATPVYPTLGRTLRVDPGTYRLTVSIAEPYRSTFDIAPADAQIKVKAVVSSGAGSTHRSEALATESSMPTPTQGQLTAAPDVVPPDSALPDNEALPAWGIRVENREKSGRAFLNFGATAWNAGPGALVVEGFRDPSATQMQAFQYFYEDDAVVGKVSAGELEYDARDGHDHWHFRDFAAYSLLDATKTKIVDSGKEAFCLAPTDPIDLTVDGAEWRPWLADLGTACGEAGSLWIREVLAAGWGDTYTQYRPGQSFEITDLSNGTYYIRVLANPDGVLTEGSTANNEALRKIKIHGKPGKRWVEVPMYGLVDSEGSSCGPFC